jgi:hypothetical protein
MRFFSGGANENRRIFEAVPERPDPRYFTGVGSSRLEIAGRTVAQCDGGALDAEYALFEPADVELKATEPGNVREIGYRVTVGAARARLSFLGVDLDLVRDAAEAMKPLGATYARGGIVRRVVRHFGPTELFEGRVYDAAARVYVGAWLDVAALAENLDVAGAAVTLQAIHLASLLRDAPEDAVVMLHTLELTRGSPPGERSHRQPELEEIARVPEAIRALAEARPTPPPEREAGPSRVELVDAMRERQAWLTSSEAVARLLRIERAANAREQPTRGPLADPELWALERQLSEGPAEGVLAKLDQIERARGRTPATAYLRARATLVQKIEDPVLIAARVSTLAMSMTGFTELQLLAAQAWLGAGDARRALPYARDLLNDTSLDPELRARAEAIHFEASTPKAPPAGPLSGKPIVAIDEPPPDTAIEPAPVVAVSRTATMQQAMPVPQPSPRSAAAPGHRPSTIPPALDGTRRPSVPYSEISERRSSRRGRQGGATPKGSSADATTIPQMPAAPRTEPDDVPPRESIAPAPWAPPRESPPFIPEAAATPVKRTSEAPAPSRASSRAPPAGLVATRPSRTSGPGDTEPRPKGQRFMAGASQPPFFADEREAARRSSPAIPRPPPMPRAAVDAHSETAEYLGLPRGASPDPPRGEMMPRTTLEARALFTHLSRELGRDYRVKRGVELRTDANALEAMQAHLFETFYGVEVRNLDDWLEVRRHGAFLSEILIRVLGAEWVDISPSELGYWSMLVPHVSGRGGTRVWPFARILRYIAMGPKERDLVSYYVELRSRARER